MQGPWARLRTASIAGLAACLIVAAAAPARALIVIPDTAVFNVDIPSSFLLKGSIDFVGMVTGVPAGGVVLAGSPAATDVTFVFTITLDATPLPAACSPRQSAGSRPVRRRLPSTRSARFRGRDPTS